MMYATIYSAEDRMWTVGYFDHDGQWHAMRDCESDAEAFRFINFLNGGTGWEFDPEAEQAAPPSCKDTLLVINRVVTMLHEAMKAPIDWRTILESAITNLNAHGVDLME